MNIVILSPHFPPNYQNFYVELNRLGANVLGIADEPYDLLSPRLKEALANTTGWTTCTAMSRSCGLRLFHPSLRQDRSLRVAQRVLARDGCQDSNRL